MLMNTPLDPPFQRSTRERVVHPVGDEHPAHAQALVKGQAPVDVGARAPGLTVDLAAPEQIGRLDADHHRQLARPHHLTGLPRAVDEPEPALAGPAALGIDVILQPLQRPDLGQDRRRLRARPDRAARLQPA
jgi:hypothetical protein